MALDAALVRGLRTGQEATGLAEATPPQEGRNGRTRPPRSWRERRGETAEPRGNGEEEGVGGETMTSGEGRETNKKSSCPSRAAKPAGGGQGAEKDERWTDAETEPPYGVPNGHARLPGSWWESTGKTAEQMEGSGEEGIG